MGARRAKAKRRTAAQVAAIRDGLVELVRAHAPVSVRQAFYLAVSAGLVAKTEMEYRATVSRLLVDARRSGGLGWNTIVDHSRHVHRPHTCDDLADALADTHQHYRRALWRDQPKYVEVWCEKETLLGPLREITFEWDVPLYPCKGYASVTLLHSAAQQIMAATHDGYGDFKEAVILYLGDHDPTGVNIQQKVEEGLREYTQGRVPLRCTRLAVTEEQIETMALPLRPTKQTDSRSKGWEGGSVEVEAIPPDTLRALVNAAVEAEVDEHQLEIVRMAEASEKECLEALSAGRWYAAARVMDELGESVDIGDAGDFGDGFDE